MKSNAPSKFKNFVFSVNWNLWHGSIVCPPSGRTLLSKLLLSRLLNSIFWTVFGLFSVILSLSSSLSVCSFCYRLSEEKLCSYFDFFFSFWIFSLFFYIVLYKFKVVFSVFLVSLTRLCWHNLDYLPWLLSLRPTYYCDKPKAIRFGVWDSPSVGCPTTFLL